MLDIRLSSRKPRSALDIDELMMVWSAAVAAGLLEVSRSQVKAAPVLRSYVDGDHDAVLDSWLKCALQCLSLSADLAGSEPENLVALAFLHDDGGMASLDDLAASIAELSDSDSGDCPCPVCIAAAAVATEDVVKDLGEFGIATLRGNVVELTLLGRWLTGFLFLDSAPPADAGVDSVINALAGLPGPAAGLMARSWISRRTPAVAAS